MILNPGDDISLAGATAALDPTLEGTVIEDDVVQFRDSASGVSGEIQVRVVRTQSGSLDFVHRVRTIDGGRLWQVLVNLVGPVVSIDSDFRLDGLGDVGPPRAHRADFGSDAGFDHVAQVGWYYGGTVAAGQSGRFVYVKTNAIDYTRNDSMALLGAPSAGGSRMWEAVVSHFVPPDHY